MRVCERFANYIQVSNPYGEVSLCCWMQNAVVGSLLKQDLPDILAGKKARKLLESMLDGSYSNCRPDNCPYLSNHTIEDHMCEIENLRRIPDALYLAYESVCNYNCTCCTPTYLMRMTKKKDWTKNYEIIENKLRTILPDIKRISANGGGELFASRRIMGLLNEWEPKAPAEECSVALETNGSLFNEKNWKKISNLGKYNLSVDITIMSFDEPVYQMLSGTKLPIKNIEENLMFVKSLRESGVINRIELATVLQELNFREMPEFTRRCIEEFGADTVRIRPIRPGGIYDKNIQWFMDVRNPYHPYYRMYKEVMEDPIFKNEKVLLWSGDLDSSLGIHPGIQNESGLYKVAREIYHIIKRRY